MPVSEVMTSSVDCASSTRSQRLEAALHRAATHGRYASGADGTARHGVPADLGKPPDPEVAALFQAVMQPAERREGEIALCRTRLAQWDAEAARVWSGAGDADRLGTRLVARLRALTEDGRSGSTAGEIFKVIGEYRADLVGMKAQPRGAKAGMTEVRAKRGGPLVTGELEVLEEVQRLGAELHTERGGSLAWIGEGYAWYSGRKEG